MVIEMRLHKGVTPPGGWVYEQDGIAIYGDHADDLIHEVEEHRRNNKKDIGNAWKDIQKQVLEKYPHYSIN